MKTTSPLRTRFSVVLLLGFSGAALLSCGTSKTASNYDRDGIYGASQPTASASSNNDSNYKEYFGSLRKDDQPDQIFTNVENYNSGYDNNSVTTESYDGSPTWGSDADHVTVNVYDNGWGYNNYWSYGWGWNLGWGWNSWYGPYYGWNFNPWYGSYYGYNYGYYPYYNNYYGDYNNYHNHYYAYGNGRRNSAVRTYENPGRTRSNVYSGGRSSGTRTYSSGRTYTTTRDNSVRSYNNGTRGNSYNTPRPNYSAGTRSQAQSQPSTRSYDNSGTRSNSYSAPSRSSSSPSSAGTSSGGSGSRGGGGGRR